MYTSILFQATLIAVGVIIAAHGIAGSPTSVGLKGIVFNINNNRARGSSLKWASRLFSADSWEEPPN